MHIDCSTCVGSPRACDGCSVGFLLGPVVAATGGNAARSPERESGRAADRDIARAIGVFADAGMISGARNVLAGAPVDAARTVFPADRHPDLRAG